MATPNFKHLESIVGADFVKTDQEALETYGKDWTHYHNPDPLAVVFPKTTEEVQKIVLWARKENIALVPSGGRTGLSGGAVARNGEIIVSLERMSKIKDFNEVDRTVDCEAGVITEALQNFVADKGYLFPVNFASKGSSQIGGNVATNAGGIKVVRYGLMREWVAGLKVVTGKGEILNLNKSLVKNASGYDFRHLFIGSEGTLGIVTEVTLKFTTPPEPLQVLVLGVNELSAVMKVFETFQKNTDMMAFELFDSSALKHVLHASNELKAPFEADAPIYLLIETENRTSKSQEETLKCFEQCLNDGLVIDGVISQSETQSKDLWALRENIAEATDRYSPYQNDISVRVSKVSEFIEAASAVFQKEYPDVEVVWFGHIGDGNIHVVVLRPEKMNDPDFLKICKKADEVLYTIIKDFEGSVSAEHGVGLSKKAHLSFTRSPEEIEAMKAIKTVFDPDGIMNPGKVF